MKHITTVIATEYDSKKNTYNEINSGPDPHAFMQPSKHDQAGPYQRFFSFQQFDTRR